MCWAADTGCIGIALTRCGAQISRLVPLENMNELIAVAGGRVAVAEWPTVNPVRASLAAVLIAAGGVRASRS